jgi:hypothetical protein
MKNILTIFAAIVFSFWIWPIASGVVSTYYPLKPSTILYLTECGSMPFHELTDGCRTINKAMLIVYELTFLIPLTLIFTFIIVCIQRLAKVENMKIFLASYLISYFVGVAVNFNPSLDSLPGPVFTIIYAAITPIVFSALYLISWKIIREKHMTN